MTDLKILRGYGTRMASDLNRACDRAEADGESRLQQFLGLFNSEGEISLIATILGALDDDEWWQNFQERRRKRLDDMKSDVRQLFPVRAPRVDELKAGSRQ